MSSDKLAQALREVLATLKRENERAEGPIKDTIWHGPAETLFDFIENALGAHEAGKQAPSFDECAASGQSCSYGPHGPDGAMQCRYCGEAKAEKQATLTIEAPSGDKIVAHGSAVDMMTLERIVKAATEKQAGPVAGRWVPYEPTQDMISAVKRADPALPLEHIRRLWWAMWGAAPSAPPSPLAEQAGPVANQASAPAPVTPTEDALTGLINSHLTGFYWCGRVWEAWNVGTMGEDDFTPAEETEFARGLAADVLKLLGAACPSPAVAHDAAPPSPLAEQDKEDAELTDDEILLASFGEGVAFVSVAECKDTVRRARLILRAARAKKEQP